MAHVIKDTCIACGSCEGECPVGAISAGDIAVWLIAAITLISGIEYFKSFGGVLKFSADSKK